MRAVWLRLAVLFLVAATFLFVAYPFLPESIIYTTTVSDVRRAVQKNLPIGSSRGDVKALLQQRNWDYYADPPNGIEALGSTPNVCRLCLLCKSDIVIVFRFDYADKLAGYDVRRENDCL